MSVWDRRKEILYGNGSVGEVRQSIPLQSVRSMALSAMTFEKSVIYLFIYLTIYSCSGAFESMASHINMCKINI